MKVLPLGERVLVKVDSAEEKTASGLYIPQTAQEKTQFGTVEAVGDKVNLVKSGNKILHDKYAGTNIKIDGNDYLILKEEDILAIIK